MCAKLFVGSRRVKPCPRAEVNGGEEGEEEEEEFIQNRTRAGKLESSLHASDELESS